MVKILLQILFALAVSVTAGCQLMDAKSHSLNQPVYQIPINVYLLQSESSALKARIESPQMQRVLSQVNIIWRQAGIQFYLNKINARIQ